jgi:hypothetical protein
MIYRDLTGQGSGDRRSMTFRPYRIHVDIRVAMRIVYYGATRIRRMSRERKPRQTNLGGKHDHDRCTIRKDRFPRVYKEQEVDRKKECEQAEHSHMERAGDVRRLLHLAWFIQRIENHRQSKRERETNHLNSVRGQPVEDLDEQERYKQDDERGVELVPKYGEGEQGLCDCEPDSLMQMLEKHD